MAEYEDEEVVDEEAPLSAEELFELHKEEINAAFEEKGFFRRFSDMLKGLSKPKSSAEYKLARVELNRLAAPILAVILPTIAVIVLIVVTQVTSQPQETIEVEIAETKEEEKIEEDQPEEEPEPPPEPPDEYVDVQVDTPSVTVSEMNAPTPTTEPLSVKPAPQDSVAIIKSPVTMSRIVGSRSPGRIGAMTRGGTSYGDPATEAAVYKVLRWLKYMQRQGMGKGNDGAIGDLPTTALAVLVYLAHGETPSNSKEFGETVRLAIQRLVDWQVDRNGVATFKGTDGNEYATLIATYALCEAYGMTKNPMVRDAAMKTLTRIVNNQSETGGWDYKINKGSTRDDMSFEGWALQALKAGKLAGLHPDGLDDCIKKAMRCLKTRNFRNGGFNYTAGSGPTGLTATGCLAMQLLGYGNEPEVKSALDFMRAWLPSFEAKGNAVPGGPLPGASPQYYCYYAAQCKYQAGMCENADPKNLKLWQDWNVEMKKLYCSTLVTCPETIEGVDGKPKQMGYWEKGYRGRMMGTCLCALQLMVYYRYLPTTKIEKAEKQAGGGGKAKPSKKETVDVAVDI